MLKTVTLELTIKTQVVVSIEDCQGDDETGPNCTISLIKYNSFELEQQLQAHINENQQEIMEE